MADQTNAEVSDERLRELLPCPFCGAENRVHVGFIGNTEFYLTCGNCGAHGPLMLQMTGSTIDLERGWNHRSVTSQASEGETPEPTEGDDGKMQRVSEVIKYFTDVLERFGDSCVYVRRGGVAWGAVALNRESDDKKNGVFDLQEQHDRDMQARLEQIERLIADRNEWRDKALAAPVSKRVERLETANRALAEIKESFRLAGLGTIGAHWQSLIDTIDQALQGGRS